MTLDRACACGGSGDGQVIPAFEALEQAACLGWADILAGRYANVADDQLDDFVGQLGRRAAVQSKTVG